MSKKFSKTILSSAVAGLLMMSSGAMAAEMAPVTVGNYTINFFDNGQRAQIVDNTGVQGNGMQVNTTTGRVTVVNIDEVEAAVKEITSQPEIAAAIQKDNNLKQYIAQTAGEAARYSVTLPSELPSLTLDNIKNLTPEDITAIKQNVESVAKVITSKTAADYNQAVSNGMSSEAALTVAKDGGAVLKEFNRIDSDIDQLNKDTTFAIDADGNITLDETAGTGERYGVKDVVAEVVEDTTVRVAEDGSLTTARNTQTTKRVNEAVVDLDKSVRTNSQDIATNRKAIQSNSRQLQEHNARLNDHQRQIRENHEEMKRAAAQSAALAGLFQPYSVGKFNATAALGGYSDKQAVAVGVGYRFNEQTAAKAGIAASDGDVSYNVGVNFEF
ncbi:YadA-like family protein [Escherichia coli]|uniref:YadA-like family protein n=4 Tax=Escherichia coli TaxID=562 RepID=UPI000BE5E908|nr:YadA-like family protein [Escherichia coli]MBB7127806.1 YadA-like family protein [Escherichia coli]